ncbi:MULTISPECIES: tRNA dihydrouridine(20/20a) synthase DusA [Thiomicrorhabdus]|uniref:tRNA-dihydrouridine(20/20a) synthase n=1 Tax=Thiomicrorhabdus heinhorstiae TaxID=2748010 RepID=A0ABS0BSP4_9GAMM|nr:MULTISPECIES: tRNA dihydrouridine(20/20a) synthase DusA [Thiomicrorhabdus]MBF6056880.1 tRNA dihydrouridine(20/20a) synthase DusA [Thiomicrorhabdus heinhorstiae]
MQTSFKESSAQNFSVAPMLDWTDRHCRYFHRQLSRKAWLYSEMVTTGAIIYGDNLPRFLGHHPDETPIVLQLGGSNSSELAKCAVIGEEWGYSEINLNVGCPSERVQNNMIGACLMAHPELVAEDVAAMKAKINIPVTVKCRIGIDEQNEEESIYAFLQAVDQAQVDGVIIHARKAWLQGLSPKDNRDIPPLNYELVHRMKQEFPHIPIAINGGIHNLQDGMLHLQEYKGLDRLDGFMIGRAAYERPYLLSEVDSVVYGQEPKVAGREGVLEKMKPYIEAHLQSGGKLIQVTRHMLGLFHGLPGGRLWRRYLSENAYKPNAGLEVLEQAYQKVRAEQERMELRA